MISNLQKIYYEFDSSTKKISKVCWKNDNEEITSKITYCLRNSKISIPDPFANRSKTIVFHEDIKRICEDVFEEISTFTDKHLEAAMATYLFERFTIYWNDDLLGEGKDIIGISMWKNILELTKIWENKNPNKHKIHKGTPYYFLAENYLLVDSIDLAINNIFNALEEDKKLSQIASLQYPYKGPAFLTAMINDDINNHMYPFINEWRTAIQNYITEYNKEFKSNFSIQILDTKFLKNNIFFDIVSFFVYNLIYVNNINKESNIMDNDFFKLRTLDIFLNITLIIDEILKQVYQNNNKLLSKPNIKLGELLYWFFCTKKQWIVQSDLEDYWTNQLKINKDVPDLVIPKILNTNRYKGNIIRQEILTLSISYHFRNYAGHNIRQQKIIITSYEKIISNLMFSLFIAIENL